MSVSIVKAAAGISFWLLCCGVVLLLSSSQVAASKCSDVGGTCMKDVSSCSYATVGGLCPNTARCCIKGSGNPCKVTNVGKGYCRVEGASKCAGYFYTNECPDTAAIVKCCIRSPKKPKGVPWVTKVKIPAEISMNPGLSTLKPSTLRATFGQPCTIIPGTCSSQGVPKKLKKLLRYSDSPKYKNSFPFKTSIGMIKPAMDALVRIFAKVKAEKPVLYKQIKTAGGLCCRTARPAGGTPTTSLSLHSWGVAIDLYLGKQPEYGDGTTYWGVIALAPYFNAEGFYWGAEFNDAMHFEVSSKLFKKWKSAGLV